MIGTILHFDIDLGSGVIRGDDGARYRFGVTDLAAGGASGAGAGDAVDFEPAEGSAKLATEIYILNRVSTLPPTQFASITPEQRVIEASIPTETKTTTKEAIIAPAAVVAPNGKGARYFIAYFLAMLPTYILPYFGSNSGFLNTVSAGSGGGLLPGYLWHATFIAILCALAFVRGVRIQRGWLVAFPIIGGFFDLIPGFNWIPLVPTFMHAAALYVGASKDALPGFDRESVMPKVKWAYWLLTAFSAWTTYLCFTSVFSGRSSGGGIIMAFGPLIVLLISGFIGLRMHRGFSDNFQSAFDSIKTDGLEGVTGLMAADDATELQMASATAKPSSAKTTDINSTAQFGGTGVIFCDSCGAANAASDRFCADCGVAM